MTKRPSTIVISVRCDLRDIATIALWLNDSGQLPETIGRLGRTTVEVLSNMIRDKNPEFKIMTTADALSRLEQIGLKRGQRNVKTLTQRLEIEDVVLEAKPSMPILPDNIISDLAEDVTRRDAESRLTKDQMDKITRDLGGAVYGGDATTSDRNGDVD